MKDSVFLKSLTQNEKKLINAGEYMSKFKLRYESLRYIDNIKEIDPDVLKKLIEIVKSFINKNLLKGKVGEIFRLTLCRLLECISIVGVELDEKEVELFNVSVGLFRGFWRIILRIRWRRFWVLR